MHSKFQNRSTFPSGRKVMTVEEEKEEERRRKKERKKERRKKLTYENNGHLNLPETRFRNQRSSQFTKPTWTLQE